MQRKHTRSRQFLALSLGGTLLGTACAGGTDEFGETESSGSVGGSGWVDSGSGGVPGAPGAGGGGPGTGGAGPGAGGGALGSGGDGITASGGAAPVDCSPISAQGNWELCESGTDFCTAVFTDGAGCDAVCAAAGLSCAEVWENADDMCAAQTSLPQLACAPATGHQSDFCRCSGPTNGGGSGGSGSGGAPGAGGATGAGGSGTGGSQPMGDLSIFDEVPGFASEAGGTTGGGTNLSAAIVVDNMDDLEEAAESGNAAIILVEPGNYSGTLNPSSNKTIVGLGPGVMIRGNLSISGSGKSNIIIRNIAVRGDTCGSYEDCRAGSDAVYIGNGAHHVWLDHMDISDGQDGNCDMTQAADYITVSWSKFYYTYAKEHRFSNLIAGGDGETNSAGKLRITYMNSWWGNLVDSRQPRGRFGNIHMLNNYHNTGGGQIHGVGFDMALIAENNVYEEDISIFTDMGSPRGWKGVGNIGSADNMSATRGTVFTIPYDYDAMPANQVKAAVTSTDCGAGNTCTFAY